MESVWQIISAVWNAESTNLRADQLIMSDETRLAFEALWGPPSAGRVITTPQENLMNALWQSENPLPWCRSKKSNPK
jgi:hypothetical protein